MVSLQVKTKSGLKMQKNNSTGKWNEKKNNDFSERITNGKRQVKIVAGIRSVSNDPSVTKLLRRNTKFHSHIEPENEVIKIEPETGTGTRAICL